MEGLHPGAVYEELVSVRLVGMMLVIVVRQELRKNVIRYSTDNVGTGLLNYLVRQHTVGSTVQMNNNSGFVLYIRVTRALSELVCN